MATGGSFVPLRRMIRLENRRIRWLLIACASLAMVVGAAGQVVMPALGNPLLVWIDTAFMPAIVAILILLNQQDRRRLLVLICILLAIETVLTSAFFAIGMAFAILVPIIGIALIQPYLRGMASLAAYALAGIVATLSIAIVVLGVPPNGLERTQPALTITAFALVSTAALGLLWRASERQVEALDAAEREIAARSDAERELHRATREVETLIGSSPVATMALDESGRLTVWNPAAERLFGWSEAEVINQPLPAVLASGDDGDGLQAQVQRILSGNAIRGTRIASHHRTGRELLVEVHADVRHDAAGRPVGTVVQAIDVTERAALEAQLREAQRMEAVGQLAGGIAHDINNALTAVGGFAELIEAKSQDESVREDAHTISEAVGRARRLTRELLTFAQRSVLQPKVIDIAEFMASLDPVLRRLLGPGIELISRRQATNARIRVDPGQFERAIMNLAVNGRDAMPRGGTMTIETIRSTDRDPASSRSPRGSTETTWIVITVSDTGVGIPPELQDMVFEPFFTTKERETGSGLGLAMVYGFVSQSGGHVELRSAPGVGTIVEIWLPETAETAPASQPGVRPNQLEGRETILLVDDELTVAQFSRTALTRLGYAVLVANDGTSAIEAARNHDGPIDLVLTDVIMPGLQGPDVARAVVSIHPEARVAYVSGYSADAITERGVVPPGVELIEKPFTADELGSRVRAILDLHRDAASRDD